jgi:hypothetical protein
MKPLLASALAYTAMTAVAGRQVLASMSTALAGDAGDPLLTAAILAWNATHVPWSDAWYQFPIFWPTRDVLALSEHLLGASLIAAPLQWLTGSPVTAYNATVLLSYPLCGVAMYLLVWRLTRSAGAAFLAGLAYAFAPYRTGHLGHIQILLSFWMPLSLLGLHACLESRRWRWLGLFAVTWALQGTTNGYSLVYFSLVVVLWVGWFMVRRGRWRDAGVVFAALVAAAMPLTPILYRYLVAQRALGLSRGIGEITVFSADIAAPLCAPSTLTFWGWLRSGCGPEGELFAGAALIALCLVAVVFGRDPRDSGAADANPTRAAAPRWRVLALRGTLAVGALFAGIALYTAVAGPWRIDGSVRASASSAVKPASAALLFLLAALPLSRWFHDLVRRGSTATFYVLCATGCWVLAWGPFPRLFGETVLYQAPYAWLLALPGVESLRAPARLWLMVVLCLVIFMGLAVARLLAATSARTARIIVILATCGLAADGWTTISPAAVPSQPSTHLAGRTVLVLPVGNLVDDRVAVFHAVTQQYRVVNGYSGYEPPYYEALRTLSVAGDERLLAPFVARADLDVLVRRDDLTLRALLERQPDVQIVSDGTVAHYRLPSRDVPPTADSLGMRVPLQAVRSECDPEAIRFMTDENLHTTWRCGVHEAIQDLTVDLGGVTQVGAIVNALGSNGAFFPNQLRVETSEDGRTWSEAWTGSPAAAVLESAITAPREALAVVVFRRRPARYVRLSQLARSGTYTWAIAELEVWTGER